MNSHNRVYPPYSFERAEEAEFPASVDEMADHRIRSEETSESIPHVLNVDKGFAM